LRPPCSQPVLNNRASQYLDLPSSQPRPTSARFAVLVATAIPLSHLHYLIRSRGQFLPPGRNFFLYLLGVEGDVVVFCAGEEGCALPEVTYEQHLAKGFGDEV